MRPARVATLALTLVATLALPASADTLPDFLTDYSRWNCGGLYGLCGLVDPATGAEIFPRTYEDLGGFSDGRAAARLDGFEGYIDSSGELVIPATFDDAAPFAFGLAVVRVGKKFGVIDTSGAWVVEPRFALAFPVSPEVVVALDVDPQHPGDIFASSNPEWISRLDKPVNGLFHVRDGWITPQTYRLSMFSRKASGLIWATHDDGPDPVWGLMRLDETWLIEPSFDNVQEISDGLAVVQQTQLLADGRPQVFSGALDAEGRFAIPLRLGKMSYFKDGFARIYNPETRQGGVIDKAGNLVGGRFFDTAGPSDEDGVLAVVQDGRDWFDLRADGSLTPYTNTYIPRTPDLGDLECPGGALLTRQGDLWGMTRPDGAWMIPPIYQSISCFSQGIAWVPIVEEKRWCPIGPDGARRDRPACRDTYAPVSYTVVGPDGSNAHVPDHLDPDPFTNWLLWNRAYLANCENSAKPRPRLCPANSEGGAGCITFACGGSMTYP